MTDLAAVPQPGDHHARPGLDPDALYVALDRQRRSRRMQWREAAHGHDGWHRADDGCEWGQIVTEEPA